MAPQYAIAITPDGNTAYVANDSPISEDAPVDGSVTPIDTATNTAGTAIDVPAAAGGPLAIAITPDGKTAYVANVGRRSVTPIDTATNTRRARLPGGGGPGRRSRSPRTARPPT